MKHTPQNPTCFTLQYLGFAQHILPFHAQSNASPNLSARGLLISEPPLHPHCDPHCDPHCWFYANQEPLGRARG